MNSKNLVLNGIIAALYIAVTMLIQPFGFTAVQFRVSELFNHLIVFNKKYLYGIVLGVFLTNLLFSPMKGYDLIFGTGHSLLSLLITIFICKYVKNIWARLAINTIVFTLMMWLIALELKLAFGLPFLETYYTTAVGEFIVLLAGIPVMYALNKRINLAKAL
ncbi:QueT transporter family protein [Cytobacillus gottheilii]|uniref:QueT transporter family protein n=1 Tax=Cytobacillus gottheilii TaxID=859144 RepID=A0ABX8FD61_9BACI|nr:QueT transporter family protein [Cytobacillus gottheilii]QVY62194.1 QueT transporter family protein [Cytobacillus gottheilii]